MCVNDCDDYADVLVIVVSAFAYDNYGLRLVWIILEESTSLIFKGKASTLSNLSTATQILLHDSTSHRPSSGILHHSYINSKDICSSSCDDHPGIVVIE